MAARSSAGTKPVRRLGSLNHAALRLPYGFGPAVVEDGLLLLGRLILKGRGAIEAWDLHALIAAVDRARIFEQAPFR